MNQSMNPFLRPLAPAAPRGITHWASKPALTRQASQLRPTQVAAVLQPPPHGSTSVNDVETALRVACNALGRPYSAQEQALAERLKANWYTQPADVAMMDTEEAAALQVPFRLLKQIQLQLGLATAEEASPTTANTISLPLPPTTVPAPATSMAASPAGMAARVTGGMLEVPSGTLEDWIKAINERRAPPLDRFGYGFVGRAGRVRLREVERKAYSIKPEDMTPELAQQLDALHRFLTVPFFGAQSPPMATVTAVKVNHHIRMMLGWMHHERGVPKDQLSLEALVPSGERDGVRVFFDYCQWLANDRQVSSHTLGVACRALNQLSRFLYHYRSSVRSGSGVLPYSDVPVVQEMRSLQNVYRKQQKREPRASDESKKFVEWPEFLWAVDELRRECGARDAAGGRRSETAVAWALQRYLIFAILACVPDRQRTIRELRVGATLVKSDDDGRWYIRHGPSDYKTGRVYGPRPALLVSPNLYPELEVFIHKWRALLKPQHEFLFTQRCGKPLTEQGLYRLFTTTAYRLLGRKLNPHMVRDSVVTHFRSSDCSERQLEALALYMGHSLREQRETYDRRTLSQKVEPAIELLAAMMPGGAKGQQGGVGTE